MRLTGPATRQGYPSGVACPQRQRRKDSMRNPFTHKKLENVKNSAEDFGHGDAMEARFATGDLDTEETGFSFHRLKPNKRQPFGHKHDDAEEVYVVVRGDGLFKLDDEIIEVE